MKNLLKYSLFALLLAAMLLALAACGDHTHEYAEEWVKDATHHWHNPICDHKPTDRVPVGQLASHTYDNPVLTAATCTTAGKEISTCSICGYKKEVTVAATGHSYANNKQAYVTEGEVLYLYTYCDNCDVPLKTVVDDAIIVTPETAQEALDNAAKGDIIFLSAGEYGTLVIRPVLNADHTESGDWITSNYATELARTIEDVSILGTAGTKVDAIEFYSNYKGSAYGAEAPDLMCYVNIKNLVIEGITFNNNTTATNYNSPIYIDLQNVNVDGLTVKNCTLIGTNDKTNLVYIYGHQGNHTYATASKNISIIGNTVEGIARLCEFRETENITIANNTVKNVAEHAFLFSSNSGKTYSGVITITKNVADGLGERFIRMSGAGEATITIAGNAVANYNGTDEEIVKVTDGTVAATVEGNTFPEGMTVVVPTPAE